MNVGVLPPPTQTVKMPRPLLGRAASSPLPMTYGWQADPYWQNVSLLLKFDGQAGGRQYTDWSRYSHAITPVNNVQLREDRNLFADTSGFFGGTSGSAYSGLQINDHPAFAFGANNFTIEAWIFPTNPAGVNSVFAQRTATAETQLALACYVLSSKTHMVVSSNGTSWAINQTGTLNVTANAWSHLAMVRNGSQWRIYLNGQVAQTSTNNLTVFDSTAPVFVGTSYWISAGQDFVGNIAEVRVTNGVARYIGPFDPLKVSFPTC